MDLKLLLPVLTKEEKRVYHAYRDSKGILTIGDGFNIDPDHGGGLDDTECDFILQHRAGKAEKLCEAYSWFAGLSDNRKYVIIDMMYNMGAETFAKFHATHAALATGDYAKAADQMANSLWDKQVGHRADRLEHCMREDVWP